MAMDLTGGLDSGRETVFATRPDNPHTRDAVNVWVASSDGQLGMRVDIEAVAVEFDLDMTMAVPPWKPGSMSAQARSLSGTGKRAAV